MRSDDEAPSGTAVCVRLDKWLWAARFFKTRGLAQTAIDNGRALVGGERVKLSRPVRIGDEVTVRVGDTERVVTVRGLSDVRGPAPVAQTLYEETPESVERRRAAAEQRRFANEPGKEIRGRPTKRDRRQIGEVKRWE